MDRIEHAEATLAAALERHPHSCLPGGATSPADRLGTVVLPHDVIAAWDRAAQSDAQEREMASGPPRTSIGGGDLPADRTA
jgi:hypothetical protein